MERVVTSMTLPEGIAEHLRGLIHRGEFGPGDRLPPERELADQLGVARISLREAIKMLQQRGYVEVRRGAKGGAFVTELEKPFEEWRARMRRQTHELDDITDFRAGLECHAAFLAADRRARSDLSALRAAITSIGKAHSRSAFRLADSQFHEAVASASRNQRLENGIHHVRGELFTPYDLLDYVEPIQESHRDHQAIYEAIRNRDGDTATTTMRDHIERTREQLTVIVFGAPPADRSARSHA